MQGATRVVTEAHKHIDCVSRKKGCLQGRLLVSLSEPGNVLVDVDKQDLVFGSASQVISTHDCKKDKEELAMRVIQRKLSVLLLTVVSVTNEISPRIKKKWKRFKNYVYSVTNCSVSVCNDNIEHPRLLLTP